MAKNKKRYGNKEKRISQTATNIEAEVQRQDAVTDYIGACIDAARTEQQRQFSIEELEKIAAFEYGKKNNLWFKDLYSLGDPISGGGNENTLAYNLSDGYIYKSNNLLNHKNSILKLFESIKYHNEIFEFDKYWFVGFTGFENKSGVPYIEPIFKQYYIHNATMASQEEIDQHMQMLNFEKIKEYTFANKKYIVSDLRPRNVLKDEDGNFCVIDDIIKINDYMITKIDINEKENQNSEVHSQENAQIKIGVATTQTEDSNCIANMRSAQEKEVETFSECLTRNGIELENETHKFGEGTIITSILSFPILYGSKYKVSKIEGENVILIKEKAFRDQSNESISTCFKELVESFRYGRILVEGFSPEEIKPFARVLNSISLSQKMAALEIPKEIVITEKYTPEEIDHINEAIVLLSDLLPDEIVEIEINRLKSLL